MLSPGMNTLELAYVCNDCLEHTILIHVHYVPLLQYPPLHLAIMVAADSSCIIDCPPKKEAGFSSAHSDLDAAIAKFRMTAYMWQAMTAEDMRLKGLGRRSFRLDEQWMADTVSRDFLNAQHNGSLEQDGAMRSTAKVNVVRSTKTVKDLRDPNIAQQNPSASRPDALFDFFKDALVEAGGPFASDAHPIVAGLILDSHYNVSKKLIVGHAALGCHDPRGISLGMLGSHLTYSWPRFVEEITACLTDTRSPGGKVGNDNGECGTMWEACTIGQGAHLHEVGHAFGSPHRPGIMERGYASDWPKHFLPKTAYSSAKKSEGAIVDADTPNNCRWNLADALAFHMLPHFYLPTDPSLTASERNAAPVVQAEHEEEEGQSFVTISSIRKIARVSFNSTEEAEPTALSPVTTLRFTMQELERRFERTEPLRLNVLGFNGKEVTIANVWKLLASRTFFAIPGTQLRLSKQSANATYLDSHKDRKTYEWAQLLREKGPDGSIHRATSIDLRVGCVWDGGVVKYADGHKSHWGPMRLYGHEHSFGGHASEEINLPVDVEIACVEVNRTENSGTLYGVRMHLSDGTTRGELNERYGSTIVRLEPAANEIVVGFFGQSSKDNFCGVMEFGIITAPKNVGWDGLPPSVYDLPELKNSAGLDGDDQVRATYFVTNVGSF